ncbi:threonine/serine exporter family protein [Xylocopilactobacillus apicola]|uniref:Membrane protein n=1 Tax=Xylocopilactobacillus apicola TaxID=2932184 RepID=A0AAU9DIB8_9LACO|nr:threonine/serine exporter family protein [Xylocopilactobacillus apicola]BDR58111.1 membrane protein [Xylocopilactobacillus apicola]
MQSDLNYDYISQVLLKVGRIMIENGAETTRAEDTMKRIARQAGVSDLEVFSTLTGIVIGINKVDKTAVIQIYSRATNMERIVAINDLSRKFTAGKITFDELACGVNRVEKHVPDFSWWLKGIAAFMISGGLMILFSPETANWDDFIPAGVIGMLGYLTSTFLHRFYKMQFISDFVASFLIGLLAFIALKLNLVVSFNGVIIGAIMPLVPGIIIMNALRDMLAGHLLSGLVRFIEAVLTFIFIGAGLGLVLRFFR